MYYRFSRKEEYLFSFYMIGVVIFLICALLKTVDIQLGLALGLFAVFAILRFRTVNYTVKDMTYVFAVIGISVINSQANIPPPIVGAIIINSIIIIIAWTLELFLRKKALSSFIIQYRNLNLLKPQVKQELLRELSAQTGYEIVNIVIKEMNIEKGSAELEVFFREENIK
ncbi:MAG: DUF4956 domain-containing protein [Bacteroidales bacterium]